MSDPLNPLVPQIVREDALKARQREIRQQIFSELRQEEFSGVYSDSQWEKATAAVERIGEVMPIVLGNPDKMGETAYVQYYYNCKHIARVVMESFGNKRVPREPTNAMAEVGALKWSEYDSRRHTPADMAVMIWRFMYDAAIADQDEMQQPR